MNAGILVTKASGEQQPFSEQKLIASLQRAGADDRQAEAIVKEVKLHLHDGMTTRQIYRIAFGLLKTGSRHLAARYHLKQALMELGPSGYPFERYVGDILQFEGYRTDTDQFVQGKCVRHEVDVLARNSTESIVIACRYHNYAGVYCEVEVPLYAHARWLDIQAAARPGDDVRPITQCWVVTNTRFTEDALKYAVCSGLTAVGWDYPKGKGLKDRIDRLGLYPLTCLTSLTKAEKQRLLARGVVLSGELRDNGGLLRSLRISAERAMVILNEVDQLCDCSAATPAVPEPEKQAEAVSGKETV